MGVGDFDTKAAIIVRDHLASWQRLNLTAFLISGVVGGARTLQPKPSDSQPRRRATHIIAPAEMAKTPATRKIASRVVPGTKNPIASSTTPTAMLTTGFHRNVLSVYRRRFHGHLVGVMVPVR